MAAITLVLQLLAPGDLLLASHDCYGGSWRPVRCARTQGPLSACAWSTPAMPPRSPPALREEAPKLLWIETPSNPLLRITDLAHCCAAGRAAGALVAVDNTFLSPALQSPLAFGADLVVHSTTKYINGHSDVVGGAVIAADPALHESLTWWANALGLTGSPFDSFLALRGLRTLGARLRVHEENAALIAHAIADNAAVAAVHYRACPAILSTPWRRASSADSAPCFRWNCAAACRQCVPSSTACSISPWPSRWAAWNRWSRIRRR
jgi:cystathionine gamma-synthase